MGRPVTESAGFTPADHDDFQPAGEVFGIDPDAAPVTNRDPNVEAMIGLLRQDLVTYEDQERLLNAMTPSVQRSLVAKIAGLDASVVLTIKKQIQLVDTVLRRIVSEDGTILPSSEDYDISLKDAMTLSHKVSQMVLRDLPKVYGIERIQKQEEALRRVMEKHLSREQQEAMLAELERIENE